MSSPTISPQNEKQTLLEHLTRSRDAYLRAVNGVTEAQCNARLAPGCWCIKEIAEHVAIAERQMFRLFEKAATSEAPPDLGKDALIGRVAGDRSIKRQAPEVSKPKGKFATLAESVAAWREQREQVIALVQESQEDFRKKRMSHPLAGEIDGYQDLMIVALHAERHAGQIEEIKNSQNFKELKTA